MANTPSLFRVILQVKDMETTARDYATLLGTPGRRVHSSRHYFECGPIILALVDPGIEGEQPKPNPDYVYFSTGELEEVHRRASALGWLSKDDVHGEPAGQIVKRPWGERSFYLRDPLGNRLCFVDQATLFTGR